MILAELVRNQMNQAEVMNHNYARGWGWLDREGQGREREGTEGWQGKDMNGKER